MRIRLLVISNYDAFVTVRPEAEILLGLQRTNQYDITIMTPEKSEYANRFREAGIRVVDFSLARKFRWRDMKTIRTELTRGRYHILQLFNNKAIVHGLLAARGNPVKAVIYRGYTGHISWLDPFMYVKFLSPRADRVICLVESIRDLIRRNLFFNKGKAITIHKGHDVAWYQDAAPVDRKSLGIPDDAFVFVCAANVRRFKGIRYLLKATHYLPKDSSIHLLLMGRGMGLPLFQRLIETSPIRDNIHDLGFRSDVLSVVKSCDAFVLPSIEGEAITKAVIEAMSLRVCPLITTIPGNQGLVIDGQCGKLVPPRDPEALAKAMTWLNENREIARQYGNAAHEHIRNNFNIKDTIAAYDTLYHELYNELTVKQGEERTATTSQNG